MFDRSLFRREIETSLTAKTKASTPVVEARRRSGLGVIVEARADQSIGDVRSAFEAISPRFEVEPLFPEEDFPDDPDGVWAWGDRFFVGVVRGVSYDDVTANPWDLAHALRAEGELPYATPEVQRERPGWAEELSTEGTLAPGAENWAHQAMRIPAAWAASRGGAPGRGVHIAHIDTGYLDHEIWAHGNLALQHQRNFVYDEDPGDAEDRPGDFRGHGLHTSSVMAAPKVAGAKLVGVAHHARIVPLRAITTVILDPVTHSVARAMRWAAQPQGSLRYGVISMSLGGLPNLPILGVLDTVHDSNRIVVAASGQGANNGPLPGHVTVFPALNNKVFGVAGSERGDKEWDASSWFSAWPFRTVHASAPAHGVPMASSSGRTAYSTSSGTSYATAYVAGIAAMWLAHHFPNGYTGGVAATWRFRDHAHDTARRPSGFGPGRWGIIDAEKLIKTAPPAGDSLEAPDEALPERSRSTAGHLAELLGALRGADSLAAGDRLVADLIGPPASGEGYRDREREMLAEEAFALLTDPRASSVAEATALRDDHAVVESLRAALLPEASEALASRLRRAGG